jgi:DNA replication and repair protein RecF
MAVLSLRTTSFRNLANAEVNTEAKNIFFVGENGQGKTNLLEALYFCSYGSSFRGVKDADLGRFGESDFSAAAETGVLGREGLLDGKITIKYERQRKSIFLDGKKIEDRKDLLEASPCVVFCHEDMEFVSGSQERRRWFFDQTQSLYDPAYLDDLRRYRKVLKTRNMVLKNARADYGERGRAAGVLDVLDPQLAEYGLRLMEKRRTAVERFSTLFGPLYRKVSGIDGISIVYCPSWKNSVSALPERRDQDLAQGITLSGPHRDRYAFVRMNGEFSSSASTGQRRLLALLLRVAQARSFSGMTGKTPVLLLDDVLLELDGEKRKRFLAVMPDYEQAFFTFLPEEQYQGFRDNDTIVYHVVQGRVDEKGR